ncbi:hypothetical protein [Peribacillus frigoritolerans]|uniref:hypothetical protein n=1 Tax=Peribacillus frigoritolerans TaxID=450367 RepID=UPI0010593D21|nr:hypothetical protein [Peribacillus frigoritolerans]TDL82452.1 hypothetical protein E2R53_02430 [Peribacillus frigoritolerans]
MKTVYRMRNKHPVFYMAFCPAVIKWKYSSGWSVSLNLMLKRVSKMKVHQKDFSEALLTSIIETETAMKRLIERLLVKNKSAFAEKKLDIHGEFSIEGNDPFTPEYSSSVWIGVSEENGELIDLQTIKIWECHRAFLGLTTSKKIPGSTISGEYIDESVEDVEGELVEYLSDFLEEYPPSL